MTSQKIHVFVKTTS